MVDDPVITFTPDWDDKCKPCFGTGKRWVIHWKGPEPIPTTKPCGECLGTGKRRDDREDSNV